MRHGLDVRGRELRRLCAQMQALSPLAVLGRGMRWCARRTGG